MNKIPQTRLERKFFFLNLAVMYRLRATCLRNQVGCILVHKNRLVSAGYNSSPPGLDHCIDSGCIIRDDHCIRTAHAEIAALMHLEHSYEELTAYITTQPCLNCLRQLIMANVKEIYYIQSYPSVDRDKLAIEAGIIINKVSWPKRNKQLIQLI